MAKRKVTLSMINTARKAHYRKEDLASLNKQYALEYVRAKQRGEKSIAKYYEKIPGVKAKSKKLGY